MIPIGLWEDSKSDLDSFLGLLDSGGKMEEDLSVVQHLSLPRKGAFLNDVTPKLPFLIRSPRLDSNIESKSSN